MIQALAGVLHLVPAGLVCSGSASGRIVVLGAARSKIYRV